MSAADDAPVQPLPQQPEGEVPASWIGQLSQRDFEVAFYERILDRQPNDVRLLRIIGELYAQRGQHDRAMEIDQKLVELLPDDALAHYNLACSLAMQGVPSRALEELSRAIEFGYNDFAHLDVDPDLESLRQMPQYRTLLQQYGLDA